MPCLTATALSQWVNRSRIINPSTAKAQKTARKKCPTLVFFAPPLRLCGEIFGVLQLSLETTVGARAAPSLRNARSHGGIGCIVAQCRVARRAIQLCQRFNRGKKFRQITAVFA